MGEKNNVVSISSATKQRDSVNDPRDGGGSYEFKNSESFEAAAAQLGFVFQYDSRANQLEVRDVGGWNWQPASDGLISHLAEEIEKVCWLQEPGSSRSRPLRFGGDDLGRVMLALSYRSGVDPFGYWLASLGPWDGIERIDPLLEYCFGAAADVITKWASAHIMLGSVWRTMQPGCLIREVPILIGPQGLGKSALLRNLFPKDQQTAWFSDSYSLHEDGQRQIESTIGSVLVELSEMTGLRKAELERVKGDLTRTTDRMRFPYQRSVSRIPRRFLFCGTSNSDSVLPNDPSGNSRFIPIHCPTSPGPIEPFMDECRVQLWAEAVARYEAGERPTLPAELRQAQADLTDQYRDRDHVLEDQLPQLMSSMVKPTLTDIMTRLGMASTTPTEQRRVSIELKRLGYFPQKTSQGRFWAKPDSTLPF